MWQFRLISLSVILLLLPNSETLFLQEEYYSEAKFYCDTAGNGNKTLGFSLNIVNQYWLLPKGELVLKGSEMTHKFNIDKNFTLTIHRITEEDFGNYFCLLVLNDSTLSVHRHGLNLHGAAFDSLHESYARRAMIGTLAAVGILVFILGICVVYRIQFSKKAKRRKAIADEISKGVDRYSTAVYDNVGFEAYMKRSTFRKTSK